MTAWRSGGKSGGLLPGDRFTKSVLANKFEPKGHRSYWRVKAVDANILRLRKVLTYVAKSIYHSGTKSLHFSIFLYIPYIISSPAEIQNPSKHRARMTREDRNLTSGLSEVDVESRTSEKSSVPPPIQSSRCFRSSYPGTKKNINPGLGNESPQKRDWPYPYKCHRSIHVQNRSISPSFCYENVWHVRTKVWHAQSVGHDSSAVEIIE